MVDLTADTFRPAEHTTFHVELTDGNIDLVLDRVDVRTAPPGAPRAEPFTLTFLGPPGGHLPQQIHTLVHPTLGRLEIFLVPLGPLPDGRHQYEAVFN